MIWRYIIFYWNTYVIGLDTKRSIYRKYVDINSLNNSGCDPIFASMIYREYRWIEITNSFLDRKPRQNDSSPAVFEEFCDQKEQGPVVSLGPRAIDRTNIRKGF